MFAFDTLLPVNALFVLFVLLCLGACVVGLIETQEQDPADREMPTGFRDVRDLTNFSGRATPQGKNGAGRNGATGKQPRRPRTK